MRNPVRSETDAFFIALGTAVVLGVSIVLGALTTPWAGVALFVGALIGAFIWEVGTQDPDRRRPLREAAAMGAARRTSGPRRLLVVANRTLDAESLRAELVRRARRDTELRFVVPILPSRVHYIVSDVDREMREAQERLDAALGWAHDVGLHATGRVGDPNVALEVIEDELRVNGADEIVISTYSEGRSNWLETGIVERLHEELDIPVSHLVAEAAPVVSAP
jgi:GABA permease